MRIAMLSWESLNSIAVGGLAAHVTELAEALQRLGHDVHVFTRMDAGQSRYDCIGGVHYHRCPFDPNAPFVQYIGRMCAAFRDRLQAAERFYGWRFDVLHAHDWLCVQALDLMTSEPGRRVVLTFHSTEFGRCGNRTCNGTSQAIRKIECQGVQLAHRLICVSGALAGEVRDLYSAPAEKVAVVYNGVNVHRFDGAINGRAARRDLGIGEDDPIVLFVGRLTWQKAPDLMLAALPRILSDWPDVKFVFVGDGDMRAGLEGETSARGLHGGVRFLGYRNGAELVRLFKCADVLSVPSRNEPFGIVVLEGWSAARPVVVTRNGGPSEFVRDQETGFLVQPTVESITCGLQAALADPGKARRIGHRGRAEVERRFNWEAIARETCDVYDSITP